MNLIILLKQAGNPRADSLLALCKKIDLINSV